ncbi:MAG: hypothetical protein H0W86_11190, partial [Armatimonadetes bacterium]|nr:hypothetical protein [Armatimonadota bacterium]
MDLYDVMAEGCHTSLTAQQIAELINAGGFKRNQACRKVGQTRWSTIDELFPLVEHSSGNGVELPSVKPGQRPTAFPLGIAVALATALLAGGIHFLWLRPAHRAAAGADTPAANRGYFHSATTPHNPGSDSLRINQERLEAERRQGEKLAREH